MNRQGIASLFKSAVESYLRKNLPKYSDGKYAVSEKELQKQFALVLMDANIPFKKEPFYHGDKKRIDFRLFSDSDAISMEIEIEWYANWGDGFAKRTFQDMHKLDRIRTGQWGMFLALNIGNKYVRVGRGKTSTTKNPEKFFRAERRRTFFERKWRETTMENGGSGLLKCNPRFWRWRHDKRCDVTVLTCFGKKRAKHLWTPR